MNTALIASPEITGNIGSCTTQATKVITGRTLNPPPMYEEIIERFRKEFAIHKGRKWILTEDESREIEDFIKAELQAQQTAYEKDKAIHLAIQASNYEQEILMLKAN